MLDIFLDQENGVGFRADRANGHEGGWRRFGLLSVVLVAQLLVGAPAAAQQMAAGSAVVRVPPVAQMEVEPLASSPVRLAATSPEATGAFRIQVRANHGWEIRVAAASAPAGGGTLWVRTTGRAGSGEFRRVPAGAEVAVASGGMGESVIRLDYRWVAAAGTEAAVAPLTYTLASR